MSNPQNFFPSLRDVAEQTDAAKDNTRDVQDAVENDGKPLEEIESLCMKCGEQGITRMLLTSIPFFREVIVMSFRCDHCGTANNEIQTAGQIRPEGTTYTLKVLNFGDLDRQIIRSEACTVEIPEYELILPPSRGQLTTVEGFLRDIIADLSLDQPLRRIQDENTYNKIEKLITSLKETIAFEEEDEDGEGSASQQGREKPVPEDKVNPSLTIKLDDPSGNSFIEFSGSMSDPKWNFKTYERTTKQNIALGLLPPEADTEAPKTVSGPQDVSTGTDEEAPTLENEEVFEFPGICSRCYQPLITRMKKVSIPYFKDTLIMSTNCENCGYRDNEIKSGAAISEQGKKITLKVEDQEDLARDILKSETAGLTIPEIDLVLQPGTLGGRFTTLEGILDQVYEELSEKAFTREDSVVSGEDRVSFEQFLQKLKDVCARIYVKSAANPFTLILDDPLANSYLQNLYAPDPDPNMTIETYDRSWQQNEDLGLNDMKVEDYEEDADKVDKVEGAAVETS
ncbi:zf-ZPR1-domain-containing protein [Coniophora puteana RWD-64-598 SS2]|uniref:Zf-ZPR1-domain-containing protein n=1 Tax=Coniophora puteana (strain RWD-64-598) TaxID=741705 RepID=A0A5M3MJ75_CONPW|nr:zf-ZPR1-domain-containing protein [Coniophora puteana RWD-64-598 SS2]EIW79163.1 zf-ZPR1-domain-containing protein [Coniophora puteana RWD-64-598 SS2]